MTGIRGSLASLAVMRPWRRRLLAASAWHATTAEAQAGSGTIVGACPADGPAPASPVIRMGADPRCSRAAARKALDTRMSSCGARTAGWPIPSSTCRESFQRRRRQQSPSRSISRGACSCPAWSAPASGQTLQISNSDPPAITSTACRPRQRVQRQPACQRNGKQVSVEVRGCRDAHQVRHPPVDAQLRGRACHIHTSPSAAPTGRSPSAACPPGRHTIQTWHEAIRRPDADRGRQGGPDGDR